MIPSPVPRLPGVPSRSSIPKVLTGLLPVLVLAALMPLFLSCSRGGEKTLYHCPMHPSIVSDAPGDCPVCGMRLVPADGSRAPGATQPPAAPAPEKTSYTCPMHPQVTSDKPGQCPICGMDLVPAGRHEEPGTGEPAIPGLARVTVTPESAARMGLTYGAVELRQMARETRTSARIVPDEKRLFTVTTKVGGWVERLFVDVTGQAVRRGQPLLSLYSPDLLASEQEFVAALRTRDQLASSPYPSVANGGGGLVEAARNRLRLWDVPDATIARIESTRSVERAITLLSPASGFVLDKKVLQGQKIMPGEPLMTVADLSTVWAEADLYEADIPFVSVGMRAELSLPFMPGKTFEARVAFLDPVLNPQSRTLRARLTIPNPGFLLKPDMYGDVRLKLDLGRSLAVPASAILPAGSRNIAFVAAGDGSIRPVEVTLGPRSGDDFVVLAGLHQGDRVVTSANFLVDSESSLKAALQAVSAKAAEGAHDH